MEWGTKHDVPGQEEVEAQLGTAKFRARGYDLLVMLVMIIATINTVFLYVHMDQANRNFSAILDTNKSLSELVAKISREELEARQKIVRALNFQACLSATTDPMQKERQYMEPNSFCNRVAGERNN